jgi:FAD/FMN-containing dehydrogenase
MRSSLTRGVWALVLVLAGCVTRRPHTPTFPNQVHDVSRLNPVSVAGIVQPTSTEQIAEIIRGTSGPISIGGSRHSMGGQTAAPGAVQLDMRRFNRILAFDSAARTITVQAGITWRQIQARIDSANLSVKIMQSYANFTVGGSLSVNAHGRYVGLGPIVGSVRSFRIVLADGSVVEASRAMRPEIFAAAIGGYGAIGVITDVTLDLVENSRVRRSDQVMPLEEYPRFFAANVADSAAVVFHNADLYPPWYDMVRAVSYTTTAETVTNPERLAPVGGAYRLERFAAWMLADWPGGKFLRQRIVDPIRFVRSPVMWRNREASLDAEQLEPASRDASTYVLQEYFVPTARFAEFAPAMREILRRHRPNILNISIRHATRDTVTLLSWAPQDVFAFVIYYKQDTDMASQRVVGTWTRALIDAALDAGGSYYLPYQLHATAEQFHRAYPRAREFFALKRRLDPTNRFRNMLWDKYYSPGG